MEAAELFGAPLDGRLGGFVWQVKGERVTTLGNIEVARKGRVKSGPFGRAAGGRVQTTPAAGPVNGLESKDD